MPASAHLDKQVAADLRSVQRDEAVFVGGVNTTSCVLHTSFDAQARDFGVVVLEDACGSMNGRPYHEAALRQIQAAIEWTTTGEEFGALLGAEATRTEAAALRA